MRIACPRCRYSGDFTVVLPIMVTVDVDAEGQQTGGADFANEGRGRWINCPECRGRGKCRRTRRTWPRAKR